MNYVIAAIKKLQNITNNISNRIIIHKYKGIAAAPTKEPNYNECNKMFHVPTKILLHSKYLHMSDPSL